MHKCKESPTQTQKKNTKNINSIHMKKCIYKNGVVNGEHEIL
jgi:hypothetical protein